MSPLPIRLLEQFFIPGESWNLSSSNSDIFAECANWHHYHQHALVWEIGSTCYLPLEIPPTAKCSHRPFWGYYQYYPVSFRQEPNFIQTKKEKKFSTFEWNVSAFRKSHKKIFFYSTYKAFNCSPNHFSSP